MAFPRTDALHSRVDKSFQDGTGQDPLVDHSQSDKSAAVRGPSRGSFKGAAQGGAANHTRSSMGAHSAVRRLRMAQALSAAPGVRQPAAPPGAGSGIPSMMATPPNFKAQVARAAQQQGVHASVGHVHNAIDSLTQKGAFTPLQGSALKAHNGPLQGPAGQRTMGMIHNELVTNPAVQVGP